MSHWRFGRRRPRPAELLRNVRDDLGLAFIVIVHLSPAQPSALRDILATRTRMPVSQVEHTVELKPNSVYVIPPDRELVLKGDSLTARPFTEPRGRRAPIDTFFQSVASGRGDGMAVLLSGSGSDGTLGIRAVKEAGGVIFAQDPAEAEYGSMPENAISTGVVDFVAPVAALGKQIEAVMSSKEALRRTTEEEAEQELRQIITLVRLRTGHNFTSYKPQP